MIRWARPVILFLALLAVLASGVTGAAAAKMSHPCMSMMMDDCPGSDDDGASTPPCGMPACCPVAPLPLLDGHALIVAPTSIVVQTMTPADDLYMSGLRSLPDLRPPIA